MRTLIACGCGLLLAITSSSAWAIGTADFESWDSAGSAATAGVVKEATGGGFSGSPETHAFATFAIPAGSAISADIDFDVGSVMSGNAGMELGFYYQTTSEIPNGGFAPGSFRDASSFTAPITFSGTGAFNNIDVSEILNSIPGGSTHFGFEWRHTASPTHVAVSNLNLDFVFNTPPTIDSYSAEDGGEFSAAKTTLSVDATTSDAEDFPPNLSYTLNNGNAGSTAANGDISESVTLAQAAALGLANPGATADLDLTVTDSGGLTDGPDSLTLSYDNAETTATVTASNGGAQIDVTINDADLQVADDTPGFSESILVDLIDGDGLTMRPTDVVDSETNNDLSYTLSQAEIDDILANDGLIQLLVDPQFGGNGETIDIDIAALQVVPEPASVAIWSLLGLALGGFALRRGRK